MKTFLLFLCFMCSYVGGQVNNITVAIIGAGFAGLRAAQRFEQLGIGYTVFEGSDRIGGRVYPFAYQNGYLQYGAEYVNGVENEIYDIVKKNNILSATEIDEEGYESVVYGQEVNNKLYKIWDKFESSTNEKLERDGANRKVSNQTVSERIDFYFDAFMAAQKLTQPEQTVMQNMNKLFKNQYQLEWSSLANDLCLKNFDTWDSGVDSEATLNQFGFKNILDELSAKVPKTKIRLLSKVANVDYSGSKVKITLSNGQSSLFDSVIITSSLGYLKRYKSTLFTPSLPVSKSAAIERFGFGNNIVRDLWDPLDGISIPQAPFSYSHQVVVFRPTWQNFFPPHRTRCLRLFAHAHSTHPTGPLVLAPAPISRRLRLSLSPTGIKGGRKAHSWQF